MKLLRGLPRLVAVLIALSAVSSPAQTQELIETAPPVPPADTWARADEVITNSPLVTDRRLENGLRYVIRPHKAPDQRLSLRLLVNAGSLNENDDERGYAHFVEHMAFNGTKNFPAGELVKFLQRQGAQFGPHVNANTTYQATIYRLDLPSSEADLLETGLRVFRDFADGILFESDEVKRERGVILNEERTRSSPQQDQTLAYLRLLYGHTSIPQRNPIGVSARIQHADRAALQRFYDAWYRPENMSVVIVGDISPELVESLIKKHFASLAARGSTRYAPVLEKLAEIQEPRIAVHRRPFAGMTIVFAGLSNRSDAPVTWGSKLHGLQVKAASMITEDRLTRRSRSPGAVIGSTSSEMIVDFQQFRRVSLSAQCAPKDLTPALTVIDQELRNIQAFGFQPDELARQQEILRQGIRNSANSVSTAPAAVIANAFVDYLQEGSPLRLANEASDGLLEAVDRLTPEDCQHSFREFFGEQPPRIFISCASAFAPSVDAVAAAYQATHGSPLVRAEAGPADGAFAYEDFGPPGSIAEKTHIADLDLWQIRLGNGVRVNLKRTAFEAGAVHFVVRLGYGRLSEPADQPGLGLWFSFLWEGGTGKHSVAELNRQLGGLQGTNLKATDDASELWGRLPRTNLPRALRQLTALISDPAFNPDGWEPTRRSLKGYIDPLWASPEGAVASFAIPLLSGKDSRLGIPLKSLDPARTPEQFKTWLSPQLASGPIEVSLVGDFDLETVLTELTQTLGTLPERQPRDDQAYPTALKFHTDRKVDRYFFRGPAERASRWEFFWRIREPVTVAERVRIEMLAEIFQDRVREEVREKKGSAYLVEGGVSWNDTYPGFSFIRCSVDHRPADREKHTKAVRQLALKIAEKGVTADELARAKAQFLASGARNRTNNAYWIHRVLADSQQRPARLDAARSVEADISGTTIADINALAARYFGPDRVFHYLIEPSALMPKKK